MLQCTIKYFNLVAANFGGFYLFIFFFSYYSVTHLFSPSNDISRVGEDHPLIYLTIKSATMMNKYGYDNYTAVYYTSTYFILIQITSSYHIHV